MRRTREPEQGSTQVADRVTEPQRPAERRRPLRLYLILAGLAVGLGGVMLAVAQFRTGHLGRYGWLSLALLGLAVATAAFRAILTRRAGPAGIRTTEAERTAAEASGGFLEPVSSVLSIIASVGTVIALLLPLIPRNHAISNATPPPTPSAHSTHSTNPCAMPLSGPAHWATLSSSQDQAIQVSGVFYSLYSDDPDDATAQLHSSMYGRLAGHLPKGSVIYVVGIWDKKSISVSTHVHGYPHYYPRGELLARPDGCWSLSDRNVGEPGSVGLSERIYFMLANPSAARVLEKAEGTVDEHTGTGLTQDQMNALNVTPVAFFQLKTIPYDWVPD